MALVKSVGHKTIQKAMNVGKRFIHRRGGCQEWEVKITRITFIQILKLSENSWVVVAYWCIPLIPEHKKQRQEDQEFKASLA